MTGCVLAQPLSVAEAELEPRSSSSHAFPTVQHIFQSRLSIGTSERHIPPDLTLLLHCSCHAELGDETSQEPELEPCVQG